MSKPDLLLRNVRLATMRPDMTGLGIVEDGALAIADGRIVFAGALVDLPTALSDAANNMDCDGRWADPGLIDCHTHLVHAGNRANEFEMRLAGATYRRRGPSWRWHRFIGQIVARRQPG